jgi:hypothetical protein
MVRYHASRRRFAPWMNAGSGLDCLSPVISPGGMISSGALIISSGTCVIPSGAYVIPSGAYRISPGVMIPSRPCHPLGPKILLPIRR